MDLVVSAQKKLRALVRDESRGWGDDKNALQRIATRIGVPCSYLWRLLYRSREMKDVRAGVLLKLSMAYDALCERQMRRLHHEREERNPADWIAQDLTRAADALVSKDNRKDDAGRKDS